MPPGRPPAGCGSLPPRQGPRDLWPFLERARRADEAARAGEGAGAKLQPEKTLALVRARQPQALRQLGREAKARVIGRIADEQHGAVAAHGGTVERCAHQYCAEAEPLQRWIDGDGTE